MKGKEEGGKAEGERRERGEREREGGGRGSSTSSEKGQKERESTLGAKHAHTYIHTFR